MYRLYWKCIHAFYCLFFGICGLAFLYLYFTTLIHDDSYLIGNIGVICMGMSGLALSMAYVLHRCKQPWMSRFIMWMQILSAHIFLLPFILAVLHLPWAEKGYYRAGWQPPAVGIFIVIVLAWMGWGVPRIYRRTIRPYYGASAKAIITRIEDSIERGSLTPLKYTFAYRYEDQHHAPHDGKHYTVAVPRLDALKVGDTIDILYDPRHPENSVWPMG